MNLSLFLTTHSWAGQYEWLDRLAVFFAVYSGYILIAVVLYLITFRSSPRYRLMFLEAVASVILARLVVAEIIKRLYQNPRPFDNILTDTRNMIPETGFSFPSGHASLYFALATAVWFYNRKLGYVFYSIAVLMGLARVMVGVHWPFDVLGGIVVGIFSSMIIHYFSKKSFGKL